MISNFDKVKVQLQELTPIINSFKSEAVQLRVVEMLLSGKKADMDDSYLEEQKSSQKPLRKRKKASKMPSEKPSIDSDVGKGKEKRKSFGAGAIATLAKVYADGYFSDSKSIKDILEHCETNLARKIRANEISGKLARMVRSGELVRSKNADNQYEYKKP